jgi:hypothetical protein
MSKSIEGLTIELFKIKLSQGLYNCCVNILIIGKMKNCLKEVMNPTTLSLNPYGKFFKQLPKTIERVIRWGWVPLELDPFITKAQIESINETESRFRLEIEISQFKPSFTIEYFKDQINTLAKKDDVIELNFTNSRIELFSIYTKPSLMLDSIEYDESALWTGYIPEDIRSEADTLRILRWLLFPLLFIALIWVLSMNPDSVTSRVPALFSESTYGHAGPHYQITLSKALKFSKLEDSLVELQKQNKTEEIKPVLDNIGELFDVKNVTLNEVYRIKDQIEQVNLETNVFQKFFGLFTLTNFMWLSVVMLLLVGVYLSYQYILIQVLDPTFDLLEIFVYFLISMVVIEGFRFTSGLGFFITLVGVLLGIFVGCGYSNFLHSPFRAGNHKVFYTFSILLKILPLAIYYESTLLSWYIVFDYYYMSSHFFLILIWNYIGFNQQYNAVGMCIRSFSVHAMFITSKILGITIMKCFQLPITIAGCILLSIGLFAITSNYYGDIETNRYGRITYWQKQLAMVIHLLSCVLVGYGFGIAGLMNTGYVLFILYVLKLYIELHLRKDWNKQILNILILAAVCLGGFYLYRNLDVIASLFFY